MLLTGDRGGGGGGGGGGEEEEDKTGLYPSRHDELLIEEQRVKPEQTADGLWQFDMQFVNNQLRLSGDSLRFSSGFSEVICIYLVSHAGTYTDF